jgi:hypothetical protein
MIGTLWECAKCSLYPNGHCQRSVVVMTSGSPRRQMVGGKQCFFIQSPHTDRLGDFLNEIRPFREKPRKNRHVKSS